MVRYCSYTDAEKIAVECGLFYGLPFHVMADYVSVWRSHPYFVEPCRSFSPFVRRDDGNTPEVAR